MKWLSLLSKIIGGLILGLFVATVWFGNDERCAVLVQNTLHKTFKEQFGAHFRAQVKSYTFFPLAVELEDVSVRALDAATSPWWWKARSMKLHFSVLSYLYSGFIDMHAFLQGVTSYSQVQKGYPVIVDHVKAMVVGAQVGLPISLQSLSLLDAQAQMVDNTTGVTTDLMIDSQVKRSHEGTTVRCSLKTGTIAYNNMVLLEHMQAKVSALLDAKKTWSGSLDGVLSLPLLNKEDQEVVLRGAWHHDRGDITCSNKKRSLFFSPVTVFKQKGIWHIEAQGTVPLYGLSRCITDDTKNMLEGALHLSLQGSLAACKGVLSLEKGVVQGVPLPRVSGGFEYRDNALQGTVAVMYDQQKVEGDWSITDNFTQAACTVKNSTDLFVGMFKYWYCKPQAVVIRAVWNKQTGSFVEYAVQFNHQKLDAVIQSSGRATVAQDRVTMTGILADTEYQVQIQTDPLLFLTGTYHDRAHKKVGSVTYDPITKKVTGSVSYDTVSQVMTTLTGMTLPGSGTLNYAGQWNYPVLAGSLQFTKGVVRVSGWYNFIAALHGNLQIDIKKSIVTGDNWLVKFHKGEIVSKQWNLHIDPWRGVTWAHIPWQMQECFVNWKKDLYAVLSGSFVFHKQGSDIPLLQGFLSLDRSQFRANILSSSIQKSVIPFHAHATDMAFDVHLFSKQPVDVLASPLETKASVDIDCVGTLADPVIRGTIHFSGGMINLPAHPLHLVRGSLVFTKDHMYEPVVELIAQNRIKKYLITLSVSGTAQDPHIMLDSSPPLSEQQILMLLLGGSEEESLKSMVPALLMRNIEGILFGPQGSATSHLPSWLEPLRKVTFVPQFTDQSARGGFKGAIEIEVSKRLRALIEKNFSLTEDTAVKVDYLLSDDVSLRAVRDARGDLGASVEMRFKFSKPTR